MTNKMTYHIIPASMIQNRINTYFPTKKNVEDSSIGHAVLKSMRAIADNINNGRIMSPEWMQNEIGSNFSFFTPVNYRVERKVTENYVMSFRFIDKKQKHIGTMIIYPIYSLIEGYDCGLHFVVTSRGYNPLAKLKMENVVLQPTGKKRITLIKKKNSFLNPKNLQFISEKKIYAETDKGELTRANIYGTYHEKHRKFNKTYETSLLFWTEEDFNNFKCEVDYRNQHYAIQ